MLTGSSWSEAKRMHGQFKVDASEWNTQALAIVLNLVHGRHRRTPKTITLQSLANIAAIVDCYEFHEAVEATCSSWVSTLRVSEPIPTKPERRLFLWMFNAWVFGLEDVFKSTTKASFKPRRSWRLLTTSRSQGRLLVCLKSPLWLSFDCVILKLTAVGREDRMNENRQAALDSIVAGLASLREDYAQDRKGCNWTCACFHLGALSKLCAQMNGAENPPCSGKSLTEIVYSLRDMKRPGWSSSEDLSIYRYHQGPAWHKCASKPVRNSLLNPVVFNIPPSMEAFNLGFGAGKGTMGGEEAAKQRWESSPALLESFASIIDKNKTKMMGLTLADFGSSTGGQFVFNERLLECVQS